MIVFHRLLIGTAAIFFLMLAVLQGINWYRGQAGSLGLLLAIGCGAAAVGLTYYLFNLERFLGRKIVQNPPGRGRPR